MRAWLTTNTGLKVVALGLATITWFFVHGITSESRTIANVPLEPRVRPGLTLIKASVSAVNVTIRGTREDLRQVARGDILALLDLTDYHQPGDFQVKLGPRAMRHPGRVQVVSVEPALVVGRVDEVLEREFPVKPVFTGDLPTGFALERTNLVPHLARVRGPRTLLDTVRELETLPIDLNGRRVSFREWVHLALPDPALTPVKQPWIEADVRITETNRPGAIP
jgi:YbbR domain-containing protein